ncbi:MAG: DUF3341 domain-containing protein [Sphingobacteriaceae bacterium]|jgi:hypothetical protein|nr:MAG: DUF3341 domain-containing protein [Pedobacter sp.]
MSNTKYILGHFEDPDDLMHGIEQLQANDISIYDVFTPMPIHGIEAKLGIKRSRLPIAAFCFGITGTITAFLMIFYMLVLDWPIDIGGKPAFAFPDFIPVMFELTVLFCSFGMVGTFFFANHLFPGRAPRVMDLSATDDRFIIAIDAKKNPHLDKIDHLLKTAGAVEVKYNERKYVSYE